MRAQGAQPLAPDEARRARQRWREARSAGARVPLLKPELAQPLARRSAPRAAGSAI